jgi:hypothetical protein
LSEENTYKCKFFGDRSGDYEKYLPALGGWLVFCLFVWALGWYVGLQAG